MTSLTGKFQTDLEQDEAIVACADAVDKLGWRIETVEAHRIVSYVNSGADGPPRIEVFLSNSDVGTDIRIVGSDTEINPLSQDALVAELNRARGAIQASIEEVGNQVDASSQTNASAQAPPAGWYENPEGDGSRWWDGRHWTEHRQVEPSRRPSGRRSGRAGRRATRRRRSGPAA